MSVHPKVFIDHAKNPLWGAKFSYNPDSELYEKFWVPKIKAYNEKLDKALPKEYLAPESLIPADLDTAHFNATTIPQKVLDVETLQITGLSATELGKRIADKEYSAVQVLTAFIKRATVAHQLTACALEILFDEGLERAKFLDDYQEKEGKLFGPLHGIPISLKEHHSYAGHVTHASFVSALDNVTPEFALTPQILYDLGAVFYIRTDQPQTLMQFDSCNNINSRRCKNAYNTSASPGGSSSGEGALLGMRGSPLGLGSDIGGSIRGPAAFNGAWGLKPTTKRLSMVGVLSAAEDIYGDGIGPVVGPMANSVDDLELFMKSYLSKEPWVMDQQCIPLPWRDVKSPEPSELTIGIVFDDGVCKPHPPIVRALREVEAKLKAAGVSVIAWEPHRVYEAVEVAYGLLTSDGGYCALNKLGEAGEPTLRLTDFVLGATKGDQTLDSLELGFYASTREELRAEYLRLFNERKVDFLLTPTYVGTGGKPGTAEYIGYTILWNILDYTALALPTGINCDKEKDLKDENYKPRNKYEEYEYGLYDPEISDGMPIGLTLVGRRYTEEAVLKAGKLLSEIITA